MIPLLLLGLLVSCLLSPTVRAFAYLGLAVVCYAGVLVLGLAVRVLRPILRLASVVLSVAIPVALVNLGLDAIGPRISTYLGGLVRDPSAVYVFTMGLGVIVGCLVVPLYLWWLWKNGQAPKRNTYSE